jgi:TP901 family phage tail tape measure protein
LASNRTVKTSLVAEVSGYIAGYEKAAKATRDLGTEAEKLAAKKDAINQLGAGLLAIGAVAAVGVGMAVKAFSDFDSAMSAVKANTQETAANMALLREAAIDFGASSIFTATESANAIEELGKAGTTTAAILGGALASSLDLAASSGLGIARAAEIVATTSSQFNLAGDQAGRISDTLAAGAGKALGSVDDLANGLKFVGPVASSMGVSLEETTGVLALFAKAGIVGEQGGTSLRGMLSSLTSPSKQAAAEIQELGIQLYDAQGKFLGLENVAGQLSGAYSGMKDQARDASLGVLFGNEQITAARVLYEGGAEAVNTWTAAVTDNGYAARIAADRLDNLAGDVEKLGGAFDSALIKSGSGANDILRTLTQTATSLVDAIGDTPTPVLNVGLALGGVVAATGLVGGAALIAVPKIAAFKTGLKDLGVSGPVAARGIGIAAGAVTVLTLGLSIFIAEQAKAKAKVDEYASSLAASSGKIDANTRAIATNNLASKQGWWIFESESTFDAATKLGISLDVVTDAALGNLTALKTIQSATTLGTAGSKKLSDQMKETGLSAVELSQASIAVTSGVKGEASSIEEAIRVAKQKVLIVQLRLVLAFWPRAWQLLV